jgi:hypothetical protein
VAAVVSGSLAGKISEYASGIGPARACELFNRAVGQLSDQKLEVRLAAVYILREVANDFPDLSNPIFELLQAYLRAGDIDYGDEAPPIDVQEIIKLLRDRLGES